MFPATTFTNNGTTAGTKAQLNFATYDSGNHRGPALAALIGAAALRWNARGASGAPNLPSRALGIGALGSILPTIEVVTAGGKVRYTVGQSAPCAFAGTGSPTNATGVEGFTLKIERFTSGADTVAKVVEFFVPFYSVESLLGSTAFDVGNITAQ